MRIHQIPDTKEMPDSFSSDLATYCKFLFLENFEELLESTILVVLLLGRVNSSFLGLPSSLDRSFVFLYSSVYLTPLVTFRLLYTTFPKAWATPSTLFNAASVGSGVSFFRGERHFKKLFQLFIFEIEDSHFRNLVFLIGTHLDCFDSCLHSAANLKNIKPFN